LKHDNSKLLLIGAGGHCRSVLDCIDTNVYSDIAIIGMQNEIGKALCEIPIIGTDKDIPELLMCGYKQAFIAVAFLDNPQKREELYKSYKSHGFLFPAIVDPTAVVSSRDVLIGEGVFIGKGAIINNGVKLGVCSVVNSGAIIEHDCKVGNYTHVAPGVNISGGVIVGDYSLIGTGSSIIQSVEIGERTIIGAGSVVIRSIPNGATAYGNPCKVQKKEEDA
jgi:sugar O-acyltransferase (sialic acid O-acetyltransferase NeuD family)